MHEFEQIYSRWHWTYDFFKSQKGSVTHRGRRPLLQGKVANRPILVKRLFHGGLLAPLTRDRFLTPRFLLTHIDLVDRLRQISIATPAVVFSAWRRETGFIRAEIGTEYLGPGLDASDFLFRKPGKTPPDWEITARRIGVFVQRLHQVHFLHADLNLMNFYRLNTGTLHILDLLKSNIYEKPLNQHARMRNLARLIRSVRKQGRMFDSAYVEGIVRCVQEGYNSPDVTH